MNQKLLALACLATLAVAGCKPHPPAEPAQMPADSAAQTPAVTAAAPMADQPKPALFDAKAFAGTFSGTLPCADCPGIDTTLELKADGSYQLNEIHHGQKNDAQAFDGTWTAEANDQHVRLDPNSKREDDRLYEIVSNEEIRMLGKDGQPAADTLNHSLKRIAATQ